ncbi:hypothetical protein PENTCL1PPCAC_28180, partial [Pristionchus entomophagus]
IFKGTVISDRWILTAAHCINPIIPFKVSKIVETKLHPLHNKSTLENDIALLKLDTPLIFNHLVSPICLPTPSQKIPDDGLAVATGYGKYNENFLSLIQLTRSPEKR